MCKTELSSSYLSLFLFVTISFFVCKAGPVWSAEEESRYTDRAGEEALLLWTERERDRAVAQAARRYWDYWLSQPSRRYSTQRLWLRMEQIQKWLKDPDHNSPPPPPPLPRHWMPSYCPPPPYLHAYSYPYPYPYYPHPYPPFPYYANPYAWAPPPYYPYPAAPGNAEGCGQYRTRPEESFEKGD